ncbi:MAG: GTPase HflX [Armatimonadetes bacterium]|nr:GTPase HflX [Armatimonadota bacterium]
MSSNPTTNPRERAVLVRVQAQLDGADLDLRLEELTLLADTAGCDAVASVTQNRERPDPKTYVGKGKLDEVKAAIEEHEAELVIFDHDLKPSQQRNLEQALGRTVIDRTQLILDIFARRARTRLACWEVELAQLQYELPRFRRMWTHLSRIEGGVGFRGPGETQLEVDRRRARERIHMLQQRLRDAERQKEIASQGREGAFTVALVGYTNVGKSTLLNALTGADAFVEDRLFATLDATTRRMAVDGQEILLTDTVGFIRDLPHTLVASFHATLSEVLLADLLLHVADLSSPELGDQIASVRSVLTEIGAAEQPVLMVYNKVDRMDPETDVAAMVQRFEADGVVVSAHTGQGLEALRGRLLSGARERHRRVVLSIPFEDGKAAAYLEAHAKVLERSFDERGVRVTALLAPADLGRLREYVVAGG